MERVNNRANGWERRRWRLSGSMVIAAGVPVVSVVAEPACEGPEAYTWVHQFGTEAHDLGRHVAVDGPGNVYVTGWTTGEFPDQQSAGGWDAFLARHSPEGEPIWIRQFGASQDDRGMGVAVDGAGDIYVTGGTFGAFPGHENASGADDVYLAKFAPDGSLHWIEQFGTTAGDHGYSVILDGTGHIYISGSTWGTFPGHQATSQINAMLARYTIDGEQLWVRQLDAASGSAPGVAADENGYAYVAGYTVGVFPGQQSEGPVDAFLTKYSPEGEEVWLVQFGNEGATAGRSVAVDGLGGVYIAGHTSGTFPGQQSAGSFDAYLARFTVDGELLWLRQFGTSGHDEGLGVSVDGAGNAYVTGSAAGAFPGQAAAGPIDAFLAAYSPEGEQLWVKQFGTVAGDYGRGIAVHSSGPDVAVYITGRTWGAFPGFDTNGLLSVLLAKWTVPSPCPPVTGDLTGDGAVGVDDLMILLAAWGPCPPRGDGDPLPDPGANGECPADLSGDGSVGVDDLMILLANWG